MTRAERATRALGRPRRVMRGVREGEFFLVFQPIVELPSRRPVGAEALLRWNRGGSISPDRFIPQMERTGVIHRVGIWVIEQALRATASWFDTAERRDSGFFVSVNISGTQLEKRGFADDVLRLCVEADVATSTLRLEIIESSYSIDDEIVRSNVAALRANGVRLALDDFGTGCSNLERLDHTEADVLKVDRGFVSRITAESGSFPLVESILGLAAAMTLTSVAEGVENVTQERWLSSNNCGYAQGFLYSPGIPEDEFDGVYRRLLAVGRA